MRARMKPITPKTSAVMARRSASGSLMPMAVKESAPE